MRARRLLGFLALLLLAARSFASAPQKLSLYIGESKILDVDAPKKVVLGDKSVVDVSLLSKTEVLVNAKSQGQTSLMVWTADGEVLSWEVEVQSLAMRKTMIEVDVEVLELANSDDWDLGIDWSHLATGPDGLSSPSAKSPREVLENNPGLLAFGTFSRGPIDVMVNMLVEKDKARLLAKPKLMTVSGGTASFLSGGQVPVVNQDSQGRTSTDYKNYGVGLDVQPTADEGGNVNATLRAEVSTLDPANAVHINNSTIPALRTRWVKTTICVKKDGTIVIAGLIQEEEGKVTNGVPLLSDIPLLGELFKSTHTTFKRGELVIFVTPKVMG
jgi:pilus assembly protein CpaC